MDVIEAIKTRRSIRKYLDLPVEWDKICEVIDAGRLAPSAGNLQNWKFIIVTDEGKRKQLAEACIQQWWMEKAPVHIIICVMPKKAIRFYGIRGDRLYSIQNAAAAAENMLLTAHSIGLGACWVGAFDDNAVKRVLGIIEEATPQIIVTLGYPNEKPIEPLHYKIENVSFFESWGKRIKDMDITMQWYGNALNKRIESSVKTLKKKLEKLGDKISPSEETKQKKAFERYKKE